MVKKHIIFDLDDTLSKEVLYLKSAYLEIANYIASEAQLDASQVYSKLIKWYQDGENTFENAIRTFQLNSLSVEKKDFLDLYRNHKPAIRLKKEVIEILDYCRENKFSLGLLTDGRSVQQRNKVKALNLESYFQEIVISEEFGSEKPDERNFRHFESKFGKGSYYYIGDNTSKDFITPNKLGWISVCLLDQGENIHKQNFELDKAYLPQITICDIAELRSILSS